MNKENKRILDISTAAFFIVPIVGAIIAAFIPGNKVQAHYVESSPNHAHVCTSTSALSIRQQPNIKSKYLGDVEQGKVVQIKATYSDWESGDTWYLLKPTANTNNVGGYVSGQYICF